MSTTWAALQRNAYSAGRYGIHFRDETTNRPLRFSSHPNLVLDGLPPYGEDLLADLVAGEITLRRVKPCTRCSITTTNQATGTVEGEEPLRTLKSYRWDKALRGVTFGQNLVVVSGAGARLRVGLELRPAVSSAS